MDARINTIDEPSTFYKNLVNFGPVMLWVLQARLRQAGYTLSFATHF